MLLAERDYSVELWARDPVLAEAVNRHRRNPRYLSDFKLSENIHATHSLEEALGDAELVVSVVPSHAVRDVWSQAAGHLRPDALIVSGTKGIEIGTMKTMSEVVAETLPGHPVAVLSGPTFAAEVARGLPTAVTLASHREAAGWIAISGAFSMRPPTTLAWRSP